jgi:hypothetical protein
MPLPVEIQTILAAPGPAELGPASRPKARSPADLARALESAAAPAARRDLIHAALLLWHDHLDAAHQIAQGIENADGSYVHAIVHRREPDYGNAKYWLRRVGNHACFPELAARVSHEPGSETQPALIAKLIARDRWDPFAFVGLCAAAAETGPEFPGLSLLRRIQQIEFEVLLEHFCKA